MHIKVFIYSTLVAFYFHKKIDFLSRDEFDDIIFIIQTEYLPKNKAR